MGWLTGLRDLFRTVDGLMQIEQKHGIAIEELKQRVARLEANGPVVVAEAKAAAAAAASAVAAQHVGELAHRQGGLEERARQQDRDPPRRRLTDPSQ